MKIILDPGHGQYENQYPPQPKYYEGTQMWKLCEYLAAELKQYGAEVITTRPKITDNPTMSARGEATAGADLFISLHSNAVGVSDTKTTGTVIFYSMHRPDSKVLADKIGAKVSALMGHHFRGSQTLAYPGKPDWDYYNVIRSAVEVGCKAAYIVEHGFHTSTADAAFLIVDSNLKKLAEAEAEIIAAHYGLKKPTKPSGVIYRVQVGAFSVKSNADNLLAQLKKDGYSGFIVSDGAVSVEPVQPAQPEPIKQGDKVRVKNAVTYTGGKFATFYSAYDVIQVSGDRVVIGIGSAVVAAVNIKDIEKNITEQ